MTAACVPSSGGSRSAKSGWPLYQPTNGPTDDARQVFARDAELAVVRRADGEDHRVVKLEQFLDRDIAADRDIADEVDAGGFGDLVVALGTAFSDWWSGATPKRIRP